MNESLGMMVEIYEDEWEQREVKCCGRGKKMVKFTLKSEDEDYGK